LRGSVGRRSELKRLEMPVGFDGLDGFVERQAAVEPPPLAGVAMPLEVEAVTADPIEASKGRVELVAKIVREVGAAG